MSHCPAHTQRLHTIRLHYIIRIVDTGRDNSQAAAPASVFKSTWTLLTQDSSNPDISYLQFGAQDISALMPKCLEFEV